MGEGQGKKVVYIKLSKMLKNLTVKVSFEGYADFYVKFMSRMMQKEFTGSDAPDTLSSAFPDKAVFARHLQRHDSKGKGGVASTSKGRAQYTPKEI